MSSSEYLNPTFLGGWATVLAVAAGVGYTYYAKSQPTSSKAKAAAPVTATRKENRAKKQRQAAYSTAAQNAPAEKAEPAIASPAPARDRADEADNRAFAAQMASVQEGKKFSAKPSGEKKKKQKSVKQSHAAEPVQPPVVEAEADAEAEEEPSAASSASAGGAEADDNQSPAVSPEVAPRDPSGVEDMLESAAAGPSVMRLTDTDKLKSKAKATKAPEKTETKKQRQNRKKAEERKAAREEDEKERKVLMEKQRRSAREAAGIPAKDGSQFIAATNGGKSAWSAGAPSGPGKEAEKSQGEALPVQPLDTFEKTETDGPATSAAPAPAQAKAKAEGNWISTLPSEEEQMEMIKDDNEWNTVPTKSSKKGKKTQEPAPEVSSAPVQEAQPAPQRFTKQSAPVNGKSAAPAQNLGSFGVLSSKDNADEEETEWDV